MAAPQPTAGIGQGRPSPGGQALGPRCRSMVGPGDPHPVDQCQRKPVVRVPHLAGHLPFVGATGTMAGEEPVERSEERCRCRIGPQALLEALEPCIEVGRQLGRPGDDAPQVPELPGGLRRGHVAEAAEQAQHQLGVPQALLADAPQQAQDGPGSTGDQQVVDEHPAEHRYGVLDQCDEFVVRSRRHVGQGPSPGFHLGAVGVDARQPASTQHRESVPDAT